MTDPSYRKRFVIGGTLCCLTVFLTPKPSYATHHTVKATNENWEMPARTVGTPYTSTPRIGRDSTDTTRLSRTAGGVTQAEIFPSRRRDLSHYHTVGACLASAHISRWSGALRADTAPNQLRSGALDTIGLGAAAPAARACLAHLTVATTPARELPDLYELARVAQNDTLAEAVFAKRLVQANTPEQRAELRREYTATSIGFGRLSAARKEVAQVDALGLTATALQVKLHWMLEGFYEGAFRLDMKTDSAELRGEINEILQRGLMLTPDDPDFQEACGYVQRAMKELVWITVMTHPDSLSAVAHVFQKFIDDYRRVHAGHGDKQARNSPERWTVESLLADLAPSWLVFRQSGGGGVAPRLAADFWFPPSGRLQSDTVRPVAGKVNLICLGGDLTSRISDKNFMGYSAIQALNIKRWIQEYGPNNLEVTLVRPAHGYAFTFFEQDFWYYLLFHTPAEEAAAWRWYAQAYEGLPVTIAVQVSRSLWLPPSDGRRLAQSKIQFNDFFEGHIPIKMSKEDSLWKAMGRSVVIDSMYGRRIEGMADVNNPYRSWCSLVDRDGAIVWEVEGGYASEIDDALKFLMTIPHARTFLDQGVKTRLSGSHTDTVDTHPAGLGVVPSVRQTPHGGTQ